MCTGYETIDVSQYRLRYLRLIQRIKCTCGEETIDWRRRPSRYRVPKCSYRSWKFKWSVWFRRNGRIISRWPYFFFFLSSPSPLISGEFTIATFVVSSGEQDRATGILLLSDNWRLSPSEERNFLCRRKRFSLVKEEWIIFYRKFLIEKGRGKGSLDVA